MSEAELVVGLRIPRWEVQIQGDASDIAHLLRHFRTPQLAVRKDEQNNEFFLYTEEFDGCDSHHEVSAIAKGKLAVLSGALKFSLRSNGILIDCGVCKIRLDGLRERFFQAHCIANARLEVDMRVTRTDPSGNVYELPSPPPRTVSIANLAQSDDAVAKAMRLFSAPDANSWVGLFRLFEVIQGDLGGDDAMKKFAATDGGKLSRFRYSANSVLVAGDAARHGFEKGGGTKKLPQPMSSDEATDFVNVLLQRWIATKGV